jgi:hypothetical protein
MNHFKSYFHPAGKSGKSGGSDEVVRSVEMTPAPLSPVFPVSGSGTPRYSVYSNSRPNSLYPAGDFRNAASEDILEIKCDVMVNWLHQQQLERMWTHGGPGEGVVLKKIRDSYTSCPAELATQRGDLFDAVQRLNVRVAMTVNTRVIRLFLTRQDLPYVPLQDGLRLQILPNVSFLPRCQKHHFAAFIQDTSLLIVWDDQPKNLFARAQKIEDQLMAMIWDVDAEGDENPANGGAVAATAVNADGEVVMREDIEPLRRIMLTQPLTCAATLVILVVALGTGWRVIAQEIAIDSTYLRIALVIVAPAQMWFALVSRSTHPSHGFC